MSRAQGDKGDEKADRASPHDHDAVRRAEIRTIHRVDGDSQGLGEDGDDGVEPSRDAMDPIEVDHHSAAETAIAVDPDQAEAGADMRLADRAGHARPTGDQRVHDDDLTGVTAADDLPDQFVAEDERQAGPRVRPLDDVKVGPAQPDELDVDPDLSRPQRLDLARLYCELLRGCQDKRGTLGHDVLTTRSSAHMRPGAGHHRLHLRERDCRRVPGRGRRQGSEGRPVLHADRWVVTRKIPVDEIRMTGTTPQAAIRSTAVT